MAELSFSSLAIRGFRDEAIPNTFIKQNNDAGCLAVQFPGYGYTADMPVLYYPGRVMLARGADLLQVQYAYNHRTEFGAVSHDAQDEWMRTDARAALDAVLSRQNYRQIFLMGKSIGTRVLGTLANDPDLKEAKFVWLTPILTDASLVSRIRQGGQCGLFVIGAADSFYKPDILTTLVQSNCSRSLVIPNADHSLEIENNLWASLHAIHQLVEAVEDFTA